MSPISSVAAAFASSTPSVGLDPTGQASSATPQHLFHTGGVFIAVLALVSIASYFYRRRKEVNSDGAGNNWAYFSGFFSSIRSRGFATPAATDCQVDLEAGFDRHVSMVYARFFHPTFWNVVECHPATPSAPAIYVEDEADEIPASEPKPPGMNSFLDMDDDVEDKIDDPKCALKRPEQVSRTSVVVHPPYDTSKPTNLNFTSKIIGTTIRRGAFLRIPEYVRAYSSRSSSDSEPEEPEVPSSTYDEISVPLPPGLFLSVQKSDIVNTVNDAQNPRGGTPNPEALPAIVEEPEDGSSEDRSSYSEFDLSHSAASLDETNLDSGDSNREDLDDYYGIVGTPRKLTTNRIPGEGQLVRAISHRSGLMDITQFEEVDYPESLDDEPIRDAMSSCSYRTRSLDIPRLTESSLSVSDQEDIRDEISSDCSLSESEIESSYLEYYGITESYPRPAANRRRYGMADMSLVAESFKSAIPGEERIVDTVSHHGLTDINEFPGTRSPSQRDLSMSPEPFEESKTQRDGDIDVHYSRQGLRLIPNDDSITDLMRTLLEELRDPDLDCNPRALTEYSDDDSECSTDPGEEESSQCISLSRSLDDARHAAESSCITETDSDMSAEESICPSTPPSCPVISFARSPDVYETRTPPPVVQWSTGVILPTFSESPNSPISVPKKAYIRAPRDSRPSVFGPRIPLMALPSLSEVY